MNASPVKAKVVKTLEHKHVAGSMPFFDRPGVQQLLDECKRLGVKKSVVADEKRSHRVYADVEDR